MPRPCWNFWGPYWPISRVSDHLRAEAPARGPRLLHITPPLPANRGVARPWGSQQYVHRRKSTRISSSPSPSPHPSHGALTGPLSLPLPFLITSSFSPSKRRRESTAPRAHISRSILLLSREHADGIEYGPVRPLRGKGLYFSPDCVHPILLLFLRLFLFLLRRRRHEGRTTSGLAHSFFVRWTFFPGPAKRRQFLTGNLRPAFGFQSSSSPDVSSFSVNILMCIHIKSSIHPFTMYTFDP